MKKKLYILIVVVFMLMACVETFELEKEVRASTNIEEILIVEAILTNELKQHVVFLSTGSSFSTNSISLVQNALVNIEDTQGNVFSFFEAEPGSYFSESAFPAMGDTEYRLRIQIGGNTYYSEWTGMPTSAAINTISAKRFTNDRGVDGIGIFVDADISPGAPPFLRYQYEETFKIVAPLWSPFDMVVLDANPPYAFGLEPREQEERVCYVTQISNKIIQNEGIDLTESTIENILVRFIPSDDYIISHRYSILVRQLVQSPDAFAFYQTLDELSSSASVFTDIQPGFIGGNIDNIQNPDEKVIGYFEVANVAEQRLFFNYEDFFMDTNERAYALSCGFLSAPPTITPAGNSPLKDIIEGGEFVYVRDTNGSVEMGGPFFVARRACGDCTALGSNVVPDFWEE